MAKCDRCYIPTVPETAGSISLPSKCNSAPLDICSKTSVFATLPLKGMPLPSGLPAPTQLPTPPEPCCLLSCPLPPCPEKKNIDPIPPSCCRSPLSKPYPPSPSPCIPPKRCLATAPYVTPQSPCMCVLPPPPCGPRKPCVCCPKKCQKCCPPGPKPLCQRKCPVTRVNTLGIPEPYPCSMHQEPLCGSEPDDEVRELTSGDETWTKFGLRVLFTVPRRPGKIHMSIECPVDLSLCVELTNHSGIPIDCVKAFCVTNIISPENADGESREIPMVLDYTISDSDCVSQWHYFKGHVKPTSLENEDMKFKIHVADYIVWSKDVDTTICQEESEH